MIKLPDLDAFTTFVKALPAANKALGELVQTPTGIIVFALIMVWCMKALGAVRFLERVSQRSKAKNCALEKYASIESGRDPECLKVVREISDAEHFRLATGIYAESLRRHALIDLHLRIQHRVTWIGIRNALQYFKFHSDGSLTVEPLSLFEKIGYRFNQFMTWVFLLVSAFLVLLLLLPGLVGEKLLIAFACLPVTLFVSAFSVYQNMPEYCAKRIQATLSERSSPASGQQSS